MIELSVIVPSYNEERNINEIITQINGFLLSEHINGEIILVDDGSTDNTRGIAEALAGTIPSLKVIVQPQNMGKGAAVKRGVEVAAGKKILFTDCDLAYSLDHIPQALKLNADVVVGSRIMPDSKYILNYKAFNTIYIRHLTSRIYNAYVRMLLGIKHKDTQCGFKLFEQSAAKRLFPKLTRQRFSFDTELLYLVKKFCVSITEMPVRVEYDRITSVKLFRDSLFMFKDVLAILYHNFRGTYND
ncbi:MAG: glycosyltransferase [Deltaproteobacteria bacterium]|nr:glycosyltransferase [Deltaproteobacteria bacterium]